MELKGDGFLLRDWRVGDEESLLENANNKKIYDNMVSEFPYPYTLKNAQAWIKQNQTEEARKSIFAIVIDNKVVGGIDFKRKKHHHSKTATLGYWLGEQYWGKGIMTQVVRLLVPYIFDNFDFVRIEGRVFDWNKASIRVLEKNDFLFEGRLRKSVSKDGKVLDELVYSRIRE